MNRISRLRPERCPRATPRGIPTLLPYQARLSSSSSPSPPPSPAPLSKRPTTAPKPTLPLRHIRENPDLYSHNCLRRNYPAHASSPARIATLFAQWKDVDLTTRELRSRLNAATKRIVSSSQTTSPTRDELLAEAKEVKAKLQSLGNAEPRLRGEMEELAMALPNLTSPETPEGKEPVVLSYINNDSPPLKEAASAMSHVEIGQKLGIVDFAAAASTSGHGWYFLLGDGAALEQALVQFALRTATRAGWTQVAPPSMVYAHVAAACGFQPRDEGEESQIYSVTSSNLGQTMPPPSSSSQRSSHDESRSASSSSSSPELCLAGTAEIPLAGMLANTTLQSSSLPLRRVAVSRCYRAEAGSYGAAARGLYRVHEFTKVELFGWTAPDDDAATELFDEIVDMQTDILGALGLRCRVLEMPAGDLGASASRKCDIEAYFPSRRKATKEEEEEKKKKKKSGEEGAAGEYDGGDGESEGWGEVTSTSICTDYQSRRLATRMPVGDKTGFPYTINGTALAVPRVIAAILENGWDSETETVRVPEVLWDFMDGKKVIGPAGE